MSMNISGTIARRPDFPADATHVSVTPSGIIQLFYRIEHRHYSDGTDGFCLMYRSFSGVWVGSDLRGHDFETVTFKLIEG